MLKELHEIYNVEGFERIEFLIEDSIIRSCGVQRKHSTSFEKSQAIEFINFFLSQKPGTQNFGWCLEEGVSFLYTLEKNRECIPVDFEILNSKKPISLKENFSYFNNIYGGPEEFYKGLKKLIEIAESLKTYESYAFLRESNHQILSIDSDIEDMFKRITRFNNAPFYIFRKDKYALLHTNSSQVFFFEITK